MQKWYQMTQVFNGDNFEDCFGAVSREEAIKLARREWEHLTEYDRKRRESVYLILADDPTPEQAEEGYMHGPELDCVDVFRRGDDFHREYLADFLNDCE